MEEPKGLSTAIDRGQEDNQSDLVQRHGIVEDVSPDADHDYYQEHLNDPNFDLRGNRPSSIRSGSSGLKKKVEMTYDNSDFDTESQFDRYSTSRAESAIDFDE